MFIRNSQFTHEYGVRYLVAVQFLSMLMTTVAMYTKSYLCICGIICHTDSRANILQFDILVDIIFGL